MGGFFPSVPMPIAFSTGNIDDHDMVSTDLLNEHILGRQDIGAGLVGVIHDIPELLNQTVWIGKIYCVEEFIVQFLHAQQDNTAVGVGKGGVDFPILLERPPGAFLASMRLFSRYCSIWVKSIIIFLLYQFDNIAEITVQRFADLSEDLRVDMLILTQLGKSSVRYTCCQAQILLFHILIDQEFPQFIVANSHNEHLMNWVYTDI